MAISELWDRTLLLTTRHR